MTEPLQLSGRGTPSTRALLAARAPLHASVSTHGVLALTTTRVPEGTEDEHVELSLIDVRTGDEQTLPGAEPGDRSAVWDPAGRRLALLAEREGRTVLAVTDPASAQLQILAEATHIDGAPAWSPDGAHIVVPCRRGTVLDRDRPYLWTRPFPAADATGPLEDPPQLLMVDVETGRARWLTDDDWRWSTPRWSPQGDCVAALASGDPSDSVGGQCLRLVHLDGRVEEVAIPGGRAVVPTWLDDGTLVALVAEPHGRPGGSAAAGFVVEDGTVRELATENLLGDVFGDCAAELADTYENVLLPRGRSVVVRVAARGRMGIALLDIDSGRTTTLVDGERSCTPVGLAGDLLVFTRQSAEQFPELATIDLTSSGSEARLTGFAGQLGPFAHAERIVVTSPDGGELDAWYLSRQDPPAGLPTVVVVHGGPHFTYGEAFSLDAQALCDAGFGVLYTNPRGSTGYGDAFAHAVHGDWAEGPSRDVLAVVDDAVARGWVDPARLGIAGNSYGGYLAAWLSSTTDRFAAAVIENPVIDLLGMYGTSDIGRRFFPAQLGGPPHEKADVYLSQSPLLHAHRCRTPALFVTGALDRRCPPGQAWAMHRVLCEVGTPSQVLVLPGLDPRGQHVRTDLGPPARTTRPSSPGCRAGCSWSLRTNERLLDRTDWDHLLYACPSPPLTKDVSMKPRPPVVFSAEWCGHCHRLKAQLEHAGIAYEEVDVDADPAFLERLVQLSDGEWVIPTVEFADGTALVNPSVAAVTAKLQEGS